MSETPNTLTDARIITCILPKGHAPAALNLVKDTFGIITANIHSGRGVGRLTPLRYRGVGEQSEKDILDVVVDAERADEVFEAIYHEAGIDQAHGGIIFMGRLHAASLFTLPDIPEEEH